MLRSSLSTTVTGSSPGARTLSRRTLKVNCSPVPNPTVPPMPIFPPNSAEAPAPSVCVYSKFRTENRKSIGTPQEIGPPLTDSIETG